MLGRLVIAEHHRALVEERRHLIASGFNPRYDVPPPRTKSRSDDIMLGRLVIAGHHRALVAERRHLIASGFNPR